MLMGVETNSLYLTQLPYLSPKWEPKKMEKNDDQHPTLGDILASKIGGVIITGFQMQLVFGSIDTVFDISKYGDD